MSSKHDVIRHQKQCRHTLSMRICAFDRDHLGWSGGAKVSCILRHRGVQLILAYSRTRLAILVAGKGRGDCFYFFCFFTFIPVPLFHLSTISSIYLLSFLWEMTQNTHKGWRVVKPKHNQSGPSLVTEIIGWCKLLAWIREPIAKNRIVSQSRRTRSRSRGTVKRSRRTVSRSRKFVSRQRRTES